uniref:Uncharacterized protein n=1 Tax=Solanum tuberosum TaxID=4113 RepID=M1BXG6_SOLTU
MEILKPDKEQWRSILPTASQILRVTPTKQTVPFTGGANCVWTRFFNHNSQPR